MLGAAVVLFLLDRAFLFGDFAIRLADDDQALMWTATVEYAHLHVPEPRFFGQTYNTMLEAAVAVPFWCLGMPVWVAVPLATSLLYSAAMLGMAWLAARRSAWLSALLLCLWPLLAPTALGVVATMPRGFVTALPLAVLAIALQARTPAARVPARVRGRARREREPERALPARALGHRRVWPGPA